MAWCVWTAILVATVGISFHLLLSSLSPDNPPFIYRVGRLTRALGQQHLEVTYHTVALPFLPTSLNNSKVVIWGDIHYDARESDNLNPENLKQALAVTDREDPLMVLFLGDYVHWDWNDSASELAVMLGKLKCKHKYGVLGNHDVRLKNGQLIRKKLQAAGINILDNERFDPFPGLTLVGLGSSLDHQFFPANVLPSLKRESRRSTIVMSHSPDTAQCLLQDRNCSYGAPIDLLLAGHTHGGQVWIPFTSFPILRLVYATMWALGYKESDFGWDTDDLFVHWEWASGWTKFQDAWLFVSRAVASSYNFRLFCPPELTVLRIVQL